MGKRSDFERRERDFYPTPEAAVLPLLPHLQPGTLFIEPCAGDGRLVRHLEKHGHVCADAYDIEPQHESVRQGDALRLVPTLPSVFITNPPWDRPILHAMIEHFRVLAPTWLLFDADWMHTRQAAPYLPYCEKIVAVGRVKWVEGSKHVGKDNACWYRFGRERGVPQFYGRT